MKKYIHYILPFVFLTSCSEEDMLSSVEATDAVELTGVTAVVAEKTSTRAAALDAYNYVGRSVFVNNDQMVLTTIKRTEVPINGFTYSNIVYDQAIETGQTSGGWNRNTGYGSYLNADGTPSSDHPERIYWSDATNGHTYIGYSVPLQLSGVEFDWNRETTYEGSGTVGIPVYYGSIGSPTNSAESFIDYTNDADETPVADEPEKTNSARSYKSGNEKIKRDDLLLTYDVNKVAETGGSVAKLYFHHALALVRVVVNIQGFSASSEAADSKSVVSDMVLKDMLTMYKWRQLGYVAEALDATYDAANITAIYGTGVTCDQKKDVHMWIPRPAGTGTGVGKQFTFYGLAVPHFMGVNNASTDEDKAKNLHFEFKVTYPDPMNPDVNVDKTYKAMMPNQVEFRAGHCTTINISLNHSNEQMTVGAEYMNWQDAENPDEGVLKENTTFLESAPALADRETIGVTIVGDTKATEDDATWLYNAGTSENPLIKDIYGHTGTAESPYTISTAEQLLSFAYEVQSGRDFVHQFVKLDADITLQPDSKLTKRELEIQGGYEASTYTKAESTVRWIGIGDATHKFNGFFLGNGRHINRLYGEHFFHTVGDNAVIDKLNFDNVVEVLGCGVVAHKNEGLICGCFIDGDVTETNTETPYTGSIVGENHSFIIACAHVGKVSGYNTVGGLVGFNNGTVMASYHAGEIIGLGTNPDVHATVGRRGDGTGEGVNKTNNSIMFSCYYDEELITHAPTLVPNKSGYPLSTSVMQMNAFVNSDKVFLYDGTHYTTQGKTLREVVIDILGSGYAEKSDEDLINAMLTGGIMSDNVQELFKYHFSLNEALKVFRYWLNAIAAQGADNVQTNCHDFTKEQILFLKLHYSAEHKFVYVPASYPKVQ